MSKPRKGEPLFPNYSASRPPKALRLGSPVVVDEDAPSPPRGYAHTVHAYLGDDVVQRLRSAVRGKRRRPSKRSRRES